jgi:hypothetical protein
MRNAVLGCVVLLAGAAQTARPVDFANVTMKPVNREVTRLPERGGVHLSAKEGSGVVWIDGTDFSEGTIELDVRGKDVLQQSFVGVAFHRRDDRTYEAVYLRPFNFQAADPVRHNHAVQYVAVPEFDWPVLREKFPEEFERPVGPSMKPADWVPLKVVVTRERIQVFAGAVTTPTLDVRKLGQLDRGMIGLWVGNNSDGDFANLRITPAG